MGGLLTLRIAVKKKGNLAKKTYSIAFNHLPMGFDLGKLSLRNLQKSDSPPASTGLIIKSGLAFLGNLSKRKE